MSRIDSPPLPDGFCGSAQKGADGWPEEYRPSPGGGLYDGKFSGVSNDVADPLLGDRRGRRLPAVHFLDELVGNGLERVPRLLVYGGLLRQRRGAIRIADRACEKSRCDAAERGSVDRSSSLSAVA